MNTEVSQALLRDAQELIPGGVNSPVRAFKSVGLTPRFIKSGRGCRITDEDGNEFIDYVCSWGPLIHGHAHPVILEAVARAMADGTSFGAPTRREVLMAALIREMVPSVEMVRLVSSGTEAVMSAIRLARGFTGRDKIIKFAGCYHGHSDGLLAKAGSGATTFSIPDSLGVPACVVEQTLSVAFNDFDAVKNLFRTFSGQIAAVVVEPIPANMGVIPPRPGFLEGLREACTANGALLIFDEVITGFRVAAGGAQELFGVIPDLTCLGKIIGGGLPVGAFGGRRDVMSFLAPLGGVYQAGTLSGNPLSVAAGEAALRMLKDEPPYEELEKKAGRLETGLRNLLTEKGVPHTLHRVGSILTLFFNPGPIANYDDVLKSDRDAYGRFFAGMLEAGIYLAPSPFEAWFVSTAHGDEEIETTLDAVRRSL